MCTAYKRKTSFLRFTNIKFKFCFWGLRPRPPEIWTSEPQKPSYATGYSSVAAKSLKVSRKEQRSVIRFRWTKGLSANAIQSEMRPQYGNKYSTRAAINVWCKNLMVEKLLLTKNDLVAVLLRRSQRSINSCGQTGV